MHCSKTSNKEAPGWLSCSSIDMSSDHDLRVAQLSAGICRNFSLYLCLYPSPSHALSFFQIHTNIHTYLLTYIHKYLRESTQSNTAAVTQRTRFAGVFFGGGGGIVFVWSKVSSNECPVPQLSTWEIRASPQSDDKHNYLYFLLLNLGATFHQNSFIYSVDLSR